MKNAPYLLHCVLLFLTTLLPSHADRAKDILGVVTITAVHASNHSNEKTTPLDTTTAERLRKDPNLKFTHYHQIGTDTQNLFRATENWARPLTKSDDILLRFEPQARPSKELTRLDIELWIKNKKILKTGAPISREKPLFIRGPEWNHGHLILIITIVPHQTPIYNNSKP